MKEELLKLIAEVRRRHGISDEKLENRFGSPGVIKTIRTGPRGPSLTMYSRFKSWLEQQLREDAW